jgi:hypothetical protein
MGAAILLVVFAMVAFILRDVLVQRGLPGLESRIFYSSEVYTRSVLVTGQLPYWNPFYFSGTPHFADPENLVLYPPALAMRWLPAPAFMQWMVILHVLIGAAGMVFLTRVAGSGWVGALVAALAFAGGGTVTSWLHHGHVLLLYCAAWLPWALGCAIRSASRGGVLPHAGLVAVMVLQFLSGYLQGSVYVGAVIAAYFLFRVISDRTQPGLARLNPLAQLLVLTLIAAGLAAFQLWPTLQLATEAGRSGGIDYVAASQDAWRFDDVSSLFLPFHGLVQEPVHRYLGDRTAYVGWLIVLMVPFAFTARATRQIAGFFLALAVVAIVVALGDHLAVYRLHYALFPGFRVPGRTLFVATVALAVLGALGLEQFVRLCQSRDWKRMVMPTAVALTWAVVSVVGGLQISPGSVAPMSGWPWLPIVLVATIAAVAAMSAIHRPRAAAALAVACVMLDLGLFSAQAVHAAPVPRGTFWAGMPTADGRILSTCWMDLGESLESRVPTVDGLANMYLRDYADWAALVKNGDVSGERALVTKLNALDGSLPARRDLLDLANATTVLSCAPLNDPSLRERARFDHYWVYQNDSARARAFWTCGAEVLSRAEIVNRLLSGRYSPDGGLMTTHPISVKWAAGLAESARQETEGRYRLGVGEDIGDRVRRYFVSNPDAQQLRLLAAEQTVEDTNGFDRQTGAVSVAEPVAGVTRAADREWVTGTRPCASTGTVNVVTRDRPDGKVVAEVDAPVAGDVYFSEPHFRERRAYVDGIGVDVRKVNIAFTAVPVPQGRHRVELRYEPTAFYGGAGISGLTLIGWLGVSWGTRRSPNANRA